MGETIDEINKLIADSDIQMTKRGHVMGTGERGCLGHSAQRSWGFVGSRPVKAKGQHCQGSKARTSMVG